MIKKSEIEFFQNGSADETLTLAVLDWNIKHPTQRAISAEFKWASPGLPGEGRYVGIEITHYASTQDELDAAGFDPTCP